KPATSPRSSAPRGRRHDSGPRRPARSEEARLATPSGTAKGSCGIPSASAGSSPDVDEAGALLGGRQEAHVGTTEHPITAGRHPGGDGLEGPPWQEPPALAAPR